MFLGEWRNRCTPLRGRRFAGRWHCGRARGAGRPRAPGRHRAQAPGTRQPRHFLRLLKEFNSYQTPGQGGRGWARERLRERDLREETHFRPCTCIFTRICMLLRMSNNGNIVPNHFHLFQGFVIPVNIRVTDANDNAPQFVNAPYVLNISEVRDLTFFHKLLFLQAFFFFSYIYMRILQDIRIVYYYIIYYIIILYNIKY